MTADRQNEPHGWTAVLDKVTTEARAMAPAPTTGDGPTDPAVLHALLTDIGEALHALHVAGIAFPDPELPEEMDRLKGRAKELGMRGLTEHLARSAVMLHALAATSDRATRDLAARQLWSEVQRLVTWTRMAQTEHGLMSVGENLRRSLDTKVVMVEAERPGLSLSAWPLGLTWGSQGHLEIHAMDLDTGRRVLIRDQLAELDENNPVMGRAISRFFQTSLTLHEALCSIIELDDHPAEESRGRIVFEPHFRAVPRLLPVPRRFDAPALPDFDIDDEGTCVLEERAAKLIPGEVGRMILDVSREDGETRFRVFGLRRAPVATTRILDLNVQKWLLAEGSEKVRCRPTLRATQTGLELLSVDHDLDGRIFPAIDPTCFRLAPEVFVRRARQLAATLLDPGTAALLTVSAVRLGGDRHAVTEALADLRNVDRPTLRQVYDVELAAFLGGGAKVTEDLEERVLRALSEIADRPDDADSEHIYRAVWLCALLPLDEARSDKLERIYAARYSGELQKAGVEDVCARAMIIAMVMPPDEEQEAEQDLPEGTRLPSLEAYEFVGAFADTFLTLEALGKSRRPLRDVYRYFDAQAFAMNVERRGRLPVTVPPLRLAEHCSHALLGALQHQANVPEDRVYMAIDAMIMLIAGNLHHYFVD